MYLPVAGSLLGSAAKAAGLARAAFYVNPLDILCVIARRP
jgi:hypothetical protein